MLNIFLGALKAKIFKKAIPLYCHWEITFNCNQSCPFCTVWTRPSVWKPELTTEKALDMIRQLKSIGTVIIQFVGGEPSLRKDLKEIGAYAKKLGIITIITTNGYVTLSDLAAIRGMNYIRVSLTGIIKETEVKSSTRLDPEKTLRYLVQMGKKPEIATTISSHTTAKDLNYILTLARELKIKVGLNFVGIGLSNINGVQKKDFVERENVLKSLLISKSKAIKRIRTLYFENKDVVADNTDFLSVLENGGLGVAGCRAMDRAICIKADGSVAMPCVEFPLISLKRSLSDLYYCEKAKMIRKHQGTYWFCENCSLSCMYFATNLTHFRSFKNNVRRYFHHLMG